METVNIGMATITMVAVVTMTETRKVIIVRDLNTMPTIIMKLKRHSNQRKAMMTKRKMGK